MSARCAIATGPAGDGGSFFPLPFFFLIYLFYFFGVATQTFLHSFSLNISRQKRNKNGSLIFIRRDAIFCRVPPQKMFAREDHVGVRERPPPPPPPRRTQRCVYHVRGMNDCLRRIAGLNSPASPPLEKKPDTSYNSHALQEGERGGKQRTETDKMQAPTPPKNSSNDSRHRCVKVKTQTPHGADTHSTRLHFF